MTDQQKSELLELKRRAIDGMTRYMKFGAAESESDPDYDPDFDPGYAPKHVNKCAKILDAYVHTLDRLREPDRDAKILNAAKATVLELNSLNARCDGALIETDQREDICALMITAAKRAGLSIEGDFTENWREW